MKRSTLVALVTCLLCVSLVAGCAQLQSRPQPAVVAEQATYDAVAPTFLNYVANDPAITTDVKTRRARTVETWRLRLLEEQGGSSAASQPTQ